MKDIFNKELELGDLVAFNPPLYKGLKTGIIIAFSNRMVKIQILQPNSVGGVKQEDNKITTLCFPKDIAKSNVKFYLELED